MEKLAVASLLLAATVNKSIDFIHVPCLPTVQDHILNTQNIDDREKIHRVAQITWILVCVCV